MFNCLVWSYGAKVVTTETAVINASSQFRSCLSFASPESFPIRADWHFESDEVHGLD
jgi:hypothetical protein